MTHSTTPDPPPPGRGWPRAAGLLGVVLLMSVLRPGVLLAIPLLLLLAMRGRGGVAVLVLATLAMLIALSGLQDGVWFIERAWSLLVAGWFVGLTLALPSWRLSSRAMAAVFGSAFVAAVVLVAESGAWPALDWRITDGILGSVAATTDAIAVLRQGQAMSPPVVSAMYEWARAQAAVFPAMIGVASMAALAVACWVVERVTDGSDQAIGPIGGFRFNDHLVWLMIGGLLLVVTRWGDAGSRVGANFAVFMGALYALRGAGVVMFVSGGLSFVGYALFALGLLVAAPAVVGVAIAIGIGDTWLDLRERYGSGRLRST